MSTTVWTPHLTRLVFQNATYTYIIATSLSLLSSSTFCSYLIFLQAEIASRNRSLCITNHICLSLQRRDTPMICLVRRLETKSSERSYSFIICPSVVLVELLDYLLLFICSYGMNQLSPLRVPPTYTSVTQPFTLTLTFFHLDDNININQLSPPLSSSSPSSPLLLSFSPSLLLSL